MKDNDPRQTEYEYYKDSPAKAEERFAALESAMATEGPFDRAHDIDNRLTQIFTVTDTQGNRIAETDIYQAEVSRSYEVSSDKMTVLGQPDPFGEDLSLDEIKVRMASDLAAIESSDSLITNLKEALGEPGNVDTVGWHSGQGSFTVAAVNWTTDHYVMAETVGGEPTRYGFGLNNQEELSGPNRPVPEFASLAEAREHFVEAINRATVRFEGPVEAWNQPVVHALDDIEASIPSYIEWDTFRFVGKGMDMERVYIVAYPENEELPGIQFKVGPHGFSVTQGQQSTPLTSSDIAEQLSITEDQATLIQQRLEPALAESLQVWNFEHQKARGKVDKTVAYETDSAIDPDGEVVGAGDDENLASSLKESDYIRPRGQAARTQTQARSTRTSERAKDSKPQSRGDLRQKIADRLQALRGKKSSTQPTRNQRRGHDAR
ncbi:MAG: hypothetical protein QM705_11105 [Ancrocorticia sp.]